MGNNVRELYILDEQHDVLLKYLENMTVENWRELTRDWHCSEEATDLRIAICEEALHIMPRSKRIRIAKQLLKKPEPLPPDADFTTRRLAPMIRGMASKSIEFSAVVYALSDEALERANEALGQNGLHSPFFRKAEPS